MKLEIKDLESSVRHDVGVGGAVLGREQAKTDITVRDESISKRHARIFFEAGRWRLEDLGSSNGTWVDDRRLESPTPIDKGTIFSLAQRRFEVLSAEVTAAAPAAEPLESIKSAQVSVAADDSSRTGLKAALRAAPRALRYYLSWAPRMALNPLGTIRRAAALEPLEPMSGLELASFAIPAGLFVGGVGQFGAFLASAVNYPEAPFLDVVSLVGQLRSFLGWSVGEAHPAVMLAHESLPGAALCAAAFAGLSWVYHPIARFVLERLGGSSNPRSRTNFAAQVLTFAVLAEPLWAVASILGILRQPLLRFFFEVFLAVTLVLAGLFLLRTWARVFKLFRWVEFALLGLGVLPVGLALVGFPWTLRAWVDSSSASSPAQLRPAAPSAVRATAELPSAEVSSATAASPKEPAPAPGVLEKPARADRRPASQDLEQSPLPTDDHPLGITPFVEYLEKRDAVEKAVSDKPDLLQRRDIREDYEELWARTYEIREKWAKTKEKERWRREKILVRFKDAEVFEATRAHVDRLHALIFRNGSPGP